MTGGLRERDVAPRVGHNGHDGHDAQGMVLGQDLLERAKAPFRSGPVHGLIPRSGDGMPLGETAPTGKFGRMFPKLAALVPPIEGLVALGEAMIDKEPEEASGDNADVPAGFTYLGQFVDHDITFDTTSLQETLVDPLAIHNFRTPALDLDCVYGAGPAAAPHLYQRGDPDLFEIGLTNAQPGQGDPTIPTSLPNDLPRGPNGFALIGDPRNDENLIVAQLHLQFLKFHNKVVAGIRDGSIPQESPLRKSPFQEGRDLIIWHYQWIVLHDFLGRILDPAQLGYVLDNGSSLYHDRTDPFIPVEFAGAAYRLGHSMIRASYDYNRVFREGGVSPATLGLLFLFSGRSGPGATVPIPSDWIADWRRFFDVGSGAEVNPSRSLNALVANPLKDIPNVPAPSSLAVRNLLRGRSLGLPPGQSIARYYGFEPLSPAEIAQGPDGEAAAAHGLHYETPLWYYILKEAEVRGGSRRLGQVGSRIVAEVFVGLLERDASSYLARKRDWRPTLPGASEGDFTMADLLTFVGELNPIGEAAAPAPTGRPIEELEAENPDIRQHHAEWRQARIDAGEDPNDWQAFRQHLIALGAPDPGGEEFVGFRG